MEIKPEGAPPHNPGEGAGAPPPPEETITIPKKDFDDLSHRADVSSQNYERLQKAHGDLEEARRQLAAAQAAAGNNNPTTDPVLTEKVKALETVVSDLNGELSKSKVVERYPLLKDLWSDFESFRENPDNKGMNMTTAAKAFMTEKGLLDPVRPGLERPTGGPRVPPSTGMSAEDVKKLRETDGRKYAEMVKNGQINVNDIGR